MTNPILSLGNMAGVLARLSATVAVFQWRNVKENKHYQSIKETMNRDGRGLSLGLSGARDACGLRLSTAVATANNVGRRS